MLTRARKQRLAEDVQLWLADGLVSAETAFVLRERYDAAGFGWSGLVKYLGIVGGLFVLLGLLGGVTLLAGSKGFGALLLIAIGAAGVAWGIGLARDARDRYAFSSKVIVGLGAAAVGLGIGLLCSALELSDTATLFITGAVVVPALTALAYLLRNSFLLILAVLTFFHWVGTWDHMWGSSTYEIEVQDPKLMTGAALFVFGIGCWHELQLQAQTSRFHRVYQALGLFYANLSMLILSIDTGAGSRLAWVLALSLLALAQIALGAWLKNGLVLGFGVTTLAIDLFTRYYENFWEKLDKGYFFLWGGVVLLGLGHGLERLLSQKPQPRPEVH